MPGSPTPPRATASRRRRRPNHPRHGEQARLRLRPRRRRRTQQAHPRSRPCSPSRWRRSPCRGAPSTGRPLSGRSQAQPAPVERLDRRGGVVRQTAARTAWRPTARAGRWPAAKRTRSGVRPRAGRWCPATAPPHCWAVRSPTSFPRRPGTDRGRSRRGSLGVEPWPRRDRVALARARRACRGRGPPRWAAVAGRPGGRSRRDPRRPAPSGRPGEGMGRRTGLAPSWPRATARTCGTPAHHRRQAATRLPAPPLRSPVGRPAGG